MAGTDRTKDDVSRLTDAVARVRDDMKKYHDKHRDALKKESERSRDAFKKSAEKAAAEISKVLGSKPRGSVAGKGGQASVDFSSISKELKKVVTELHNAAKAAKNVGKQQKSNQTQQSRQQKTQQKKQKPPKPPKPVKDESVKKYTDKMEKSIKKIDHQIAAAKGRWRGAGLLDKKAIEADITRLERLKEKTKFYKEVAQNLDKRSKAAMKSAKTEAQRNKVIESAIAGNSSLAEALEERLAAATQTAEDKAESFSKAMKKEYGIAYGLVEAVKEGEREYKEFAGSLGEGKGALVAFGIAAAFLFKKTADLIGKYKDAAVSLAKYRVNLGTTAKAMLGLGATGKSLETIRLSLNLTREQAGEFFKTVEDGVLAGIGSVNHLVSVSKKLQDAFGGDPTEHLRKYVDLLKEVPTLETDFAVNAKIDDRAAAIFALAEKGKIPDVIELQQAGLFGGVAPKEKSKDVKLLNHNQKMETWTQKLSDTVLQWMPTFGPQLAAMGQTLSKIFMAVSAGFAVMGAMKMMGGKNLGGKAMDLANLLKKAGLKKAARGVFRASGKLAGFAGSGSIGKMTAGGVATGTLKAAVGGTRAAISGMRTFVAGMSIAAKGATVVGLALEAVGMAGDWYAKKLEEGGNELGAATVKTASTLAKAGGMILAGAAIGSMVPVIGTAVGAIVGAGVAIAMYGGDFVKSIGGIGDALDKNIGTYERVNKEGKKELVHIKKYSKLMVGVGKAVKLYKSVITGTWIKEIPEQFVQLLPKGLREKIMKQWEAIFPRGIGEYFTSTLKGVGASIGEFASDFWSVLKEGAKAAKNYIVYSDEQVARMEAAEQELESFTVSMSKAKKADDRLGASLVRIQKMQAESAQSYQKVISAVNAQLSTAKMELYKFRQELATGALRNLGEFGGSAEKFGSVVAMATENLSQKFDMQLRAYDNARNIALRDAKMTAEDRRMAMEKVNKLEIDAARDFVDGMNAVIEAMYKSPEVVGKQLEAGIAKAKVTMKIEGGTLRDQDERFKAIDRSLAEMKATAKVGEDAMRKAQSEADKLRAQEVKKQQDAAKRLTEAQDEASKKMVKDFGITVDKGGTAHVGNVEAVKRAVKAASDDMKKLDEEAEKFAGVLPEATMGDLAKAFDANIGEIARLNTQIEEAKKKLKGEKPGKGLKEGSKEYDEQKRIITESENALQEVNAAQERVNGSLDKFKKAIFDDLAKRRKVPMVEAEREALEKRLIAAARTMGKDGKIDAKLRADILENSTDAAALGASIAAAEESMARASRDNEENMKRRAEAQRKFQELQQLNADLLAGSNLESQAELDYMQKMAGYQSEIKQQIEGLANLTSQGMTGAKIALDMVKAQSDIAAQSNDAMGNFADQLRAQGKLTAETRKVAEANLVKAKERRKQIAADLAEAKALYESTKDATVKKKAAIDITIAEGNLNIIDQGIANITQTMNEASAQMAATVTDFSAAMESLGKNVEMKRLGKQLDLGSAMQDLAQYSEEWQKMSKEGGKIVADAAKRQYERTKEAVENADKLLDQQIRAEYERRKTSGTDQEKAGAERFYTEAMRTKEVDKQLIMAQAQTTMAQKQTEQAKKRLQMQMDDIAAQQEVLDAQADYMAEIGGDWVKIVSLQRESLQLEKEKVDYAKEYYDEMVKFHGEDSREARDAARAYRMQELAYQKKSLGAQKSAYEKLAGMAFGQLRGAAGARRQVGTDVDLLGVEGTRVKTRAGTYIGAGPKGPGTIGERAGAMGAFAAFGGKGAPGKIKSLEEQQVELSKKTSDLSKLTADNTQATADSVARGNQPGSFYTHDTTAEDQRREMIALLGGVARHSESTAKSTAETATSTDKQVQQTKTGGAGETTAATAASGPAKAGGRRRTKSGGRLGFKTGDFKTEARKAFTDFQAEASKAFISRGGGLGGSTGGKSEGKPVYISASDAKKRPGNVAAGGSYIAEGAFAEALGLTPRKTKKPARKLSPPEMPGYVSGSVDMAAPAPAAPANMVFSPMGIGAGVQTPPATATSGFAGMGAGGSTSGQQAPLRVTGEVTVKFDNKMFRDAVIQIVGESMGTSQVQKKLEQNKRMVMQ